MVWLLIALGGWLGVVRAEIYCCADPQGRLEYRDSPCRPGTQQVLRDVPRDPLPMVGPKRTARASAKRPGTQLKRTRVKKSVNPEKQRARCQAIRQKVLEVEHSLRLGYPLKQELKLKARLKQLKQKEQDICQILE